MKSIVSRAAAALIALQLFAFSLSVPGRLWAQTPQPPKTTAEPRLRSRIYLYSLADGASHLVFSDDSIWEAPNWSPDGRALIVNHNGAIYTLPVTPDASAKPEKLMLPPELSCNNDKSLSHDGKHLAFSASSPSSRGSEVYLANADGSQPRQITFQSPSYFHGWSPDDRTLAFVAQRNGIAHFNLYTIPVSGGAETQLTSDPHHDDGPDYSPDGRWIYINSDRSGKEAIWRIPAAAGKLANTQAEMILSDSFEDWFPHLSPDGRNMVYIGYPAGTPTHNSRELQVVLKLAPIADGKVGDSPKTLVTTTGGQGSMNVNSWAPDSMRFAYVQYDPIPQN